MPRPEQSLAGPKKRRVIMESAVAIPDFQTIMLPLLRFASDGLEHSLAQARDHIAKEFSVSEAERKELLPSGKQSTFSNRVAWAKSYLTQAGVLESRKRGYFNISSRGIEILKNPPNRIDIKFLDQFPEFIEFRSPKDREHEPAVMPETGESSTPEETLEQAHSRIRSVVASELLSRLKSSSPQFFERLVVQLLLSMGYGGYEEAGSHTGKSGDEGIDGVIKEDRLGLDSVYLQAKKWEGTVGRPEIHKFVGALHGKRAKKGVFITTGTFSTEAIQYVEHIEPKVVLIDGKKLSELMIDFDVGVNTVANFAVKRVDSDYFTEE
jgi:restriction system protein